ncbi:MAG: hypothetical protein WD027_00670 [Gaiellales bacterium]
MARCVIGLALVVFMASACSTEVSPNESLSSLKTQQERLGDIDDQAAALDLERDDALDQAGDLRSAYADLLAESREKRPDGATGSEAVVWDKFIEITELRLEAAAALVDGLSSGDLASFRRTVERANARTAQLNREFNDPLADFRNDEPPEG